MRRKLELSIYLFSLIWILMIGISFAQTCSEGQNCDDPPQIARMSPMIVGGGVAAGGAPANIVVENAWKGLGSGQSTGITVAATAGRTLIVGMNSYDGLHANHAVTDNIGGATGWNKVAGVNGSGGDVNSVSLWYKTNIPSGITTVTVNGGTGGSYSQGICQEVSGLSSTAPYTGGEAAAQQVASSGGINVSPNVTNATADSIFFAYGQSGNGGNPITLSINATGTVGTWNLFNAACQELNGNDYNPISMPNIVVSSSLQRAHAWTHSADLRIAIGAFHP